MNYNNWYMRKMTRNLLEIVTQSIKSSRFRCFHELLPYNLSFIANLLEVFNWIWLITNSAGLMYKFPWSGRAHGWLKSQDSERLAIEGLGLGLDLGLTHINTAEMYGNGKVEEMVAESIADRRDEVFLVSKVLPSNASYEGTLKACKRSPKRLKTDWLDLYLLHWPGPYPIEETMRAMEKLRSRRSGEVHRSQ